MIKQSEKFFNDYIELLKLLFCVQKRYKHIQIYTYKAIACELRWK